MLRYLLPSVAIVGACLAVYATSLHAPPAENQLTFVPVVFDAPHPPASAQTEPLQPAPLRAENPPPLSGPTNAWAPLGGHRRLNLQHSNRGPPSIHELLLSAKAALAGKNARLVRRLREFETAVGNRLR